MGLGDELMAAGEARRLRAADPEGRRVQVVDALGAPRWHELWRNNPDVAAPGERGRFLTVTNAPNARPYIASKDICRWRWREYEPAPALVALTEDERGFGRAHAGLVVLQPALKPKASPNKHWGEARWRELAKLAKPEGLRLAQLGPLGTRPLPRVEHVQTASFRQALAVLSQARAYVGHEGGLHHAAAAFGVPAVVVYGAFISPRCTGYAAHRNLFEGKGLGCGMRQPCPCCAAAMARIEPARILELLKELLC